MRRLVLTILPVALTYIRARACHIHTSSVTVRLRYGDALSLSVIVVLRHPWLVRAILVMFYPHVFSRALREHECTFPNVYSSKWLPICAIHPTKIVWDQHGKSETSV